MLIAYRICDGARTATAFSGEGARLSGGRWNEKGTRLVYCASSVSLCMLEMLVHTPTRPTGMVSLKLLIPDDIEIEEWTPAILPPDWGSYPFPAAVQARCSAWVASATSVGVRVPSAVVPTEWNILINPQHPDWARCEVEPAEPVEFDTRLKP
jgi:RES domain-containing protein